MNRRWLAVPLAVVLLFGADRAASRALSGGADESRRAATGELGGGARPGLFPALRALLVQVWLIRIDADLRAGRHHKALRHAREALAFAPDLPAARILLASVLAFDLAAREHDPRRRLSWMAEGLSVLVEGRERDPGEARIHHAIGVFLDNRARAYPEFAEAYERSHGVDPLDAACESFVAAAEWGRDVHVFALHASWALMEQGNRRLRQAMDETRPERLAGALESYRQAANYARELLLILDPEHVEARRECEIVRDYCVASARLCELYMAAASGRPVDEADVRLLLERRDALIPD